MSSSEDLFNYTQFFLSFHLAQLAVLVFTFLESVLQKLGCGINTTVLGIIGSTTDSALNLLLNLRRGILSVDKLAGVPISFHL